MQIDITFKNIESTDALKEYATKRLSKLDKFIDRPSEVHIVLSVEKRRHKADVTLSADGVMINAVEITEDMYSAIDMVMDKLDRQVKKHKEKLQGKKGQSKAQFAEAEEDTEPAPAVKKKGKAKVILEKNFVVKPMSVDEAIMQLSVSPISFFVFQNTDSKQINIVYKRPDGDIGLVEPLV